MKYETNLLGELPSLKTALVEAFGSRIAILENDPQASKHNGCFCRVAEIKELDGFVDLYLDHHSGYSQPMYWCGLTYPSDYGWNMTGERLSEATRVQLNIDPEGRADIGEIPYSERSQDYNEDFPTDYSTFIDVVPPRFLNKTISYAFPQYGQFFLGCYFTDYSAENATSYLLGLCGLQSGPLRFAEGAVSQRLTNVYERDAQARLRRVNSPGGLDCCVCGLNFGARYGEVGQGFIHVHHIFPVSERSSGSMTTDGELVSVCPNCHAMLHRNGLKSPDDLRAMMEAASRNT